MGGIQIKSDKAQKHLDVSKKQTQNLTKCKKTFLHRIKFCHIEAIFEDIFVSLFSHKTGFEVLAFCAYTKLRVFIICFLSLFAIGLRMRQLCWMLYWLFHLLVMCHKLKFNFNSYLL